MQYWDVPRRAGWVRALALLWSLTGCAAAPEGSLNVDVRSDMLPGLEVDRVEILVAERELQVRELAADARLADGVRAARYEGLGLGIQRVRVRLFAGPTIELEREVDVNLRSQDTVTVVMTRSCRGVVCGAGEQCVGATCVPAGCGAIGECAPAQCGRDDDCVLAGASCAVGVCSDGLCLAVGSPDRCGADQLCHPETGCVDVAMPWATDAGPGDGGPADAGVAGDAGGLDAGEPDAGSPGSRYGDLVRTHPALLGYWRLDEGSATEPAVDASGHGRDGYFQGDVVLGEPGLHGGGALRFGELRPARVVVGDLDHDGVDDLDAFDFDGSRPLSLEAWVRLGTRRVTGCLVGKMEADGSVGYLFAVHQQDTGDTALRFGLAGTTVATSHLEVRWPHDPTVGFHHVVATYSGEAGRTMQLFIDGELMTQRIHRGPVAGPLTGSPLMIGEVTNWSRPRDTRMDEVAIYGDALTPVEIREHYRAGIEVR